MLVWAAYASIIVSTLLIFSQLAFLPLLLSKTNVLKEKVVDRMSAFKVRYLITVIVGQAFPKGCQDDAFALVGVCQGPDFPILGDIRKNWFLQFACSLVAIREKARR